MMWKFRGIFGGEFWQENILKRISQLGGSLSRTKALCFLYSWMWLGKEPVDAYLEKGECARALGAREDIDIDFIIGIKLGWCT